MPTAPQVTGLSYDKQAYNPGDTITVTVTGLAGTQVNVRNVTAQAQLTDTATGLTGVLAGAFTITTPVEDTTTAQLTDSDGRAYVLQSLSQTPAGLVTAVFKATA